MKLRNKIKNNVILEIIKWCSVLLLLVFGITIYYMCYNYDIYVKSFMVSFILLIAIFFALKTRLGKLVTIFGKESYFELQKVVWPSYQDSVNITLVIIVVTIIISLILWGLDTILVYLISFGLRL